MLLSTGFQSLGCLSANPGLSLTQHMTWLLQGLISASVNGRCSHFSQGGCEDEVGSCLLLNLQTAAYARVPWQRKGQRPECRNERVAWCRVDPESPHSYLRGVFRGE